MPSEKVYIGNRVEHSILFELGLTKQPPLDTQINGIPVDIKFTIGTNWSIPPEAYRSSAICILAKADDTASTFAVGCFRASENHLNAGANRDGKKTVSDVGRASIIWMQCGALPENFLLHLRADFRDAILQHAGGQPAVTELFRQVQGRPVPRIAVETIAHQLDPAKRVRDARLDLAPEGIAIFNRLKQTPFDNDLLASLGHAPLEEGYWMSLRLPEQHKHLLADYLR